MCWIHVSIQFHLGLFCEFETDILRPLFRNRGKIDNHQMNIFISNEPQTLRTNASVGDGSH